MQFYARAFIFPVLEWKCAGRKCFFFFCFFLKSNLWENSQILFIKKTFKKRDLLNEILAIIAQNLKLQRLYSYYKQQLGIVANLGTTKNSILNRLNAPTNHADMSLKLAKTQCNPATNASPNLKEANKIFIEHKQKESLNELPDKDKLNVSQDMIVESDVKMNEAEAKEAESKTTQPPIEETLIDFPPLIDEIELILD